MNQISSLTSREVEGPHGLTTAIMMGLDIGDLETLDSFLLEAGQKFTYQRMASPPTTDMLLITLIGDLTPAEFKKRWMKIATEDPIIHFFMRRMIVADVVQGDPEGRILDQTSLLD